MAISLHLDNDYLNFLNNMKQTLKQAQIKAALAVNKELIHFYWTIGSELITKQQQFKSGSNVLEQFSHDMRIEFPRMEGFSVSNLERMKKFANEYQNLNSAQAVRELP